jgi:hypothetical protein
MGAQYSGWVAVLVICRVSCFAVQAQTTNSWVNPTSGKWETAANWSAGAPSLADSANLITNANPKTVTIDGATPAGNLTISNLTVTAPNTLRALGAAEPFRVLNAVEIGTNAVLVVSNSVFQADGVAGGTHTFDGVVENLGGTLLITNNVIMGTVADAQPTFRSVAGTVAAAGLFGVGFENGATGDVWLTEAAQQFSSTGIILGGNVGGIGRMTMSNGVTTVGTVLLGNSAGHGTLTVAGGTFTASGTMTIGAFQFSTGVVWVTGGQLTATNADSRIGFSNFGQMTISNASFTCANLIVGSEPVFGGTTRGILNIIAGTNNAAGVTIGFKNGSSGSALLNGGLLESRFTTTIGSLGQGEFTLLDGTMRSHGGLVIGEISTGRGTLTVAGNSAAVVVTNGNTTVGFSGGGHLVLSNGTVLLQQLLLGRNAGATGELTALAGSLVVTNTFDPTILGSNGVGRATFSGGHTTLRALTLGDQPGALGTLTMNGGTNVLLSRMTVRRGALWVNGGELILTNPAGTLNVADRLILSNGTLRARFATFGGSGSTITMAGGTFTVDTNFDIGESAGETSTVWKTGGSLNVFLSSVVGLSGVGRMIVSNGTMQLASLTVGFFNEGTLTLAGGTNVFTGPLHIGTGTGSVWMTGGRLVTPNTEVNVGRGSGSPTQGGLGFMTISNGTWLAGTVNVALAGLTQGTLTIAGGTNSVYSGMTLGVNGCSTTGSVIVAGGRLFVTNATGNAVLEVRGGTLTINSGTLTVDTLVLTNACAKFVRNGGTIFYDKFVFDPALSAVSDGVPDAWRALFFGGDGMTTNETSCASCDPDGDGQTNLAEFQTGTNPTHSASALGITAIAREGDDLRITWMTAPGKTNALQRSGTITGGFAGITNIVTTGTTTNFLDPGAATNVPAFFYRVRLVP